MDPDYPPDLACLHDASAATASLEGETEDMHCVAPGLYLGNQRAAGILFPFEERDQKLAAILRMETLARLRSAGIRNIVCCSDSDARIFKDEGISYECALLSDGSPADIIDSTPRFAELLSRAVRLVESARARGEGTLVHCASGAHRSASIVCGILMHERHAALADVLPLLLRVRPFAYPSFWRHLVSAARAMPPVVQHIESRVPIGSLEAPQSAT